MGRSCRRPSGSALKRFADASAASQSCGGGSVRRSHSSWNQIRRGRRSKALTLRGFAPAASFAGALSAGLGGGPLRQPARSAARESANSAARYTEVQPPLARRHRNAARWTLRRSAARLLRRCHSPIAAARSGRTLRCRLLDALQHIPHRHWVHHHRDHVPAASAVWTAEHVLTEDTL